MTKTTEQHNKTKHTTTVRNHTTKTNNMVKKRKKKTKYSSRNGGKRKKVTMSVDNGGPTGGQRRLSREIRQLEFETVIQQMEIGISRARKSKMEQRERDEKASSSSTSLPTTETANKKRRTDRPQKEDQIKGAVPFLHTQGGSLSPNHESHTSNGSQLTDTVTKNYLGDPHAMQHDQKIDRRHTHTSPGDIHLSDTEMNISGSGGVILIWPASLSAV